MSSRWRDGASASPSAPGGSRRIGRRAAVVDGLAAGDDPDLRPEHWPRPHAQRARPGRVLVAIPEQDRSRAMPAHRPAAAGDVVRAAMFIRLAGFAAGGSGSARRSRRARRDAQRAACSRSCPRSARSAHRTSMHMAPIALVAIGEGRAVARRRGPVRAPRRCAGPGLAPISSARRTASRVISANGVSVGPGRARRRPARSRSRTPPTCVMALSLRRPAATRRSWIPTWRPRSRCRASSSSTADPAAPRGQRPVRPGAGPSRTHCRFASPHRSTVRIANSSASRRRCRDASLRGMDDNPLVVAGRGPDGQQRQLPPDAHGPRDGRDSAGSDPRRPALRSPPRPLWAAGRQDPKLLGPEGIARFGSAPLLRYSRRRADGRAAGAGRSRDPRRRPLDLGRRGPRHERVLVVRRTAQALELLADILAVELLIAAAVVGWAPETHRSPARSRGPLSTSSRRPSPGESRRRDRSDTSRGTGPAAQPSLPGARAGLTASRRARMIRT